MASGWLLVLRFPLRAAAATALAGTLSLAIPSAALATTPSPGPAPSPTPSSQAPGGFESAQEITLGSLGVGPQAVQGASGTVGVLLPAPAGPLAPAGSFIRVFFAHSPLLDPSSSTLTLAVNGQPLTAVRLDGSNADGSAFETRVTNSALHPERPNLLQARFELRATGAPATGDSAAYARLEPQTLLHYQLYGPPGSRPPARLDGYPFPFASRAGGSRVGLVLPRPATQADLRAALQVAADLGRRAPSQQLQPEVITAGSADWLGSAAQPAVLVGTIGRLPLAEKALQAAGFNGSPSGWTAPDGQLLRLADGLLVVVTSPFDGQSPLLLVTGFTDEGLNRATAALTGAAGRLPAGTYAVLREPVALPAAGSRPQPGSTLSLDDLALDPGAAEAPGSRTLILPFVAPAVDPYRTASLELRVQGTWQAVLINGHGLAQGRTGGSTGNRETTLRIPFSASLLNPGLNALVLRLADGAGAPARVMAGSLRLPPAPPAAAALELLPEPVFSDPGGTLVVLARLDDGVLSAAARAFAALGARGGVAPALRVVEAAAFGDRSLGRASVMAIGGSGGNPQLERLHHQILGGQRNGGADAGVVLERIVPDQARGSHVSHAQLWIDGTSPLLLQATAGTLYRHPLPGAALTLDAAGGLKALQLGSTVKSAPAPPAAAGLMLPALGLLVVAATLFGIGWQLRRPLEPAW